MFSVVDALTCLEDMTTRVPVQHYDLRTANSFIGSALHDLNTVDGSPSDIEAISDVDRDAVTEDRLDDDQDSSAVVSVLLSLYVSLYLFFRICRIIVAARRLNTCSHEVDCPCFHFLA